MSRRRPQRGDIAGSNGSGATTNGSGGGILGGLRLGAGVVGGGSGFQQRGAPTAVATTSGDAGMDSMFMGAMGSSIADMLGFGADEELLWVVFKFIFSSSSSSSTAVGSVSASATTKTAGAPGGSSVGSIGGRYRKQQWA